MITMTNPLCGLDFKNLFFYVLVIYIEFGDKIPLKYRKCKSVYICKSIFISKGLIKASCNLSLYIC